MKGDSCSTGVAVILMLASLVLRFVAGQVNMTLTTSGFGPLSLSEAGPRIVWTPPLANSQGKFTLTSAVSNSSNRYVSFAFATGQKMADAIMVVDCYDSGDAAILGTSMNSLVAGSGVNTPDKTPSDQVQYLSRSLLNGVLTCNFAMNFPSTLDVYVFLATGSLVARANRLWPKKVYHSAGGRFFSNVTIAQLLAPLANNSVITSELTAGGFSLPSLSAAAAAPRIAWSPPAVNTIGNFTLTSSASNDALGRYVSFAFANGITMWSTLTVVDCYEIGGTVMLGTSKNDYISGNRSNVNNPASREQVQLLSATKNDGVLTCKFSMKFTPTLDVYAILAEGPLAAEANGAMKRDGDGFELVGRASNPKKLYHGMNGRFVSAKTLKQVLSSASSATSSSTIFTLFSAMTIRSLIFW